MSTNKLEEIRKKLLATDRTTRGNLGQVDNTVYAHWNLPVGGQSVVRFLPDGDEDNVFFWVEKQMIHLRFPGIKGEDETKDVMIKVPCMEMYGEQDAILNEIRPWFNTELDATARSYWKKRSYLFQGFIQEDGMNETNIPENPIRRFVTTTQIFKQIKAALLDPDMIEIPTDYVNGTDFRMIKIQPGKHADWTTSTWARRESALTQQQLNDIDEHGLNNLSDFLPKKPTPEAIEAIFEMFEASVNGDLYDPDRWAQYYKPYGYGYNSDDKNKSSDDVKEKAETKAAKPAKAKPAKSVDTPPEDSKKDADKEDSETMPKSTAAILERLKQRTPS